MTEVRIIKVNGIRYVQAIERVSGKIDVLKSFGKYNLESRFEAARYVALRKALIQLVQGGLPAEELVNLHHAALAVFGYFLGMHEVERIIHQS